MEVAAIILAAGSSTRMGRSKQRLAWKSGTLLTHAINTARQAGISSIFVVLGADEKSNRNEIAAEKVSIVSNPKWESGMGTSIRAGLKSVEQSKSAAQAVLIMVCDQPFVTPAHLRSMLDALAKPQTKAVFSRYAGTTGVPAILRKDLLLRSGDWETIRELKESLSNSTAKNSWLSI